MKIIFLKKIKMKIILSFGIIVEKDLQYCKLHFGTSRGFLALKGFKGNCWRDVLW